MYRCKMVNDKPKGIQSSQMNIQTDLLKKIEQICQIMFNITLIIYVSIINTWGNFLTYKLNHYHTYDDESIKILNIQL